MLSLFRNWLVSLKNKKLITPLSPMIHYRWKKLSQREKKESQLRHKYSHPVLMIKMQDRRQRLLRRSWLSSRLKIN